VDSGSDRMPTTRAGWLGIRSVPEKNSCHTEGLPGTSTLNDFSTVGLGPKRFGAPYF
jgi:hypothetical protein